MNFKVTKKQTRLIAYKVSVPPTGEESQVTEMTRAPFRLFLLEN